MKRTQLKRTGFKRNTFQNIVDKANSLTEKQKEKLLARKPLNKQRKTTVGSAIPTEKDESLTFVEYLDMRQRLGTVCLYTHIANENNMVGGIRVALHKKRMGVRKGFPDYCVITTKGIYFIEMKRRKGYEHPASTEQKDWIELLNHFGCKAKICYGADDAIQFLES